MKRREKYPPIDQTPITHLSYTLISHRIIYFEFASNEQGPHRAFNFVIIIPVYPAYPSLSPRFDVDEKKRILPFLLSLSLFSNSGSNEPESRCSWSLIGSNPYRAEINITVSSQDERAKRICSNNKFPFETSTLCPLLLLKGDIDRYRTRSTNNYLFHSRHTG